MVWQWLINKKKPKKKVITQAEIFDEETLTEFIDVKGIGKATADKLLSGGIAYVEDFLEYDLSRLEETYEGIFKTSQLLRFEALMRAK